MSGHNPTRQGRVDPAPTIQRRSAGLSTEAQDNPREGEGCALGAAVRAARIEAASAARPHRDRVARRADQSAGRLARASARSPVRRPRLGKTTLLAQWASRSQRPFAWVSVDEKDNDPIVLLTYIAAALDRVSRLDQSVFDALASAGASIEGTVLPRLGAALARMDEDLVLVLDDLHLLDNPASLDAIEALTRHVSEGSQMALSARGRPALPLGACGRRAWRWRSGRTICAWTKPRRADAERRGIGPAGRAGCRARRARRGLAPGLYLAALSIRARGLKAKGAATFSGSDRLVSDYLRAELLAHLPEDDLGFLTRTAVLERMSGPLCDEVLKESGSAAILESLAHSNLFVRTA